MEDAKPNGTYQNRDETENSDAWYTVLATGFNAHSQILSHNTADVRNFQELAKQANILYAGWSTTVLNGSQGVWSLGHQSVKSPLDVSTAAYRSGFGDHENMLGCMGVDGSIALVESSPGGGRHASNAISPATTESSPLLSYVAMAANGKVVATFKQAPNGRLCHVAEFDDQAKFLTWFHNPSGDGNYPSQHHMLPGRPKQLLATSVSFLLLMESGEVYTWGDPRHRTLGRPIGEGATAADKPGSLEALGGLDVQKIASGGWVSAALSKDGAVYLWGGLPPGSDRKIRCLGERDRGEVALAEIIADSPEPLDLVDVAVGDAHIAVVSIDGRLFAVGNNSSGQLGLGSGIAFVEDWQAVPGLKGVHAVVCGPKATFALTR